MSKDKLLGMIVVHVEDLAVTGKNPLIKRFIPQPKQKFEISRDEPLSHFLSLQILRESPKTASINQKHYIDDLVEKFLPNHSRSAPTLTHNNFKLLIPKTSPDEIDKPYSSAVGGLLWVAQCTRADVSFAVNRFSQFLQRPSKTHWEVALQVLSYLHRSKSKKLVLDGDLSTVNAYSDADWAEDRHERESTTRYMFKLGEEVISWRSRKQQTVSLSNTEAEYMALSDSGREAGWIFHLLSELTIVKEKSITMNIDNEGAE